MAKNRKARRLENRARARKVPPQSDPATFQSRFPEVANGLATVHNLLGNKNTREAETLLTQLAAIEPANAEIHYLRGVLGDLTHNTDLAIASLQECLSRQPEHVQAAVRLAQFYSSAGDLPGALTIITSSLDRNPDNPQLHHVAGQLHEAMHHYAKAAGSYARLAELRPQHGAFELLGNAAMLARNVSDARRAYKHALRHGSRPEHVLAMLARLEAGIGDTEAAVAHLRSALRQAPADGFAYLQLANDFVDAIDADELLEVAERARPIAPDADILSPEATPMCFAYARLYELKKDHATAFAYYQLANRSLDIETGFSPDQPLERLKAFEARHQGFDLKKLGESGSQSDRPVFVFGLPRSGTTLLEQILSAHPDVAAIGEHEAFGWVSRYVEQGSQGRIANAAALYLTSYPAHTGEARRVVDKSMSTPEHIATILRLFPRARFIHCSRHPMETAWSMYTMYFGNRRVAYANSFAGIAAQLDSHQKMMQFWHERLPGLVLDIRYDDLISGTRGVATAALNHIGLDWHPACDEFYNSANQVHTASITQVRQPIYTSAAGKWRKYEAHLEPLGEMLEQHLARYEDGSL